MYFILQIEAFYLTPNSQKEWEHKKLILIYLAIQLPLEQHEFELCGSSYMHIF